MGCVRPADMIIFLKKEYSAPGEHDNFYSNAGGFAIWE